MTSFPDAAVLTVSRPSDREVLVTRRFDAPLAAVYDAWSRADRFRLWWPPASSGVLLRSCEMDVRTGGGYRLAFGAAGQEGMVFHGRYLDVVPQARMVWTNEEDGAGPVTTVTFAPDGAGTLVTWHEAHPSRDGAEEACAGIEGMMPEQFAQLDAYLAGASRP